MVAVTATPEDLARDVTGLRGVPVRLDLVGRSPDMATGLNGVLAPGARLNLGPEDWRDGHGDLGGAPLLVRVRRVVIGDSAVIDGRWWPAVELELEGNGADLPWIYVRLAAIETGSWPSEGTSSESDRSHLPPDRLPRIEIVREEQQRSWRRIVRRGLAGG